MNGESLNRFVKGRFESTNRKPVARSTAHGRFLCFDDKVLIERTLRYVLEVNQRHAVDILKALRIREERDVKVEGSERSYDSIDRVDDPWPSKFGTSMHV